MSGMSTHDCHYCRGMREKGATIAAQAERIAALEEYVDFLGSALNASEGFMSAHGFTTRKADLEMGKDLRARIGRTEDGRWEKP